MEGNTHTLLSLVSIYTNQEKASLAASPAHQGSDSALSVFWLHVMPSVELKRRLIVEPFTPSVVAGIL